MIESALETDGAQILALTATVGVFDAAEVACVDELWTAYRKQGEASGYNFIVYRDGERVAGYACFGATPLTQGTFDLYWLAVDPASHRHGVGRALVEGVEAEVQACGGRLLVVETSSTPAYAPARRFYETCGYRYSSVIHDYYALGDDLLVFTKAFSY